MPSNAKAPRAALAIIGVVIGSIVLMGPQCWVPEPLLEGYLQIGPVAGITTDWHPAPAESQIPIGTTVEFSLLVHGTDAIVWTGATEVSRGEAKSTAAVLLDQLGWTEIQATVTRANGSSYENSCWLEVVELLPEQITVSPIQAWVDTMELDDPPSNQETMDYYFGHSIAELWEVGPGRYRTSIDRLIHLSVVVDPPGIAPLIEWRLNGESWAAGETVVYMFDDIGVHTMSVGTPSGAAEIELETYRVAITSPGSGIDAVTEGVPITFGAVTDPPGYEEGITWLASTESGTCSPVEGSGPAFSTQFDDTFSSGGLQWLGVKADNAIFSVDQQKKCVYRASFIIVDKDFDCPFDPGDKCITDDCSSTSACISSFSKRFGAPPMDPGCSVSFARDGCQVTAVTKKCS